MIMGFAETIKNKAEELSGKAKEKKISVIMYILAVLFILKYLLL